MYGVVTGTFIVLACLLTAIRYRYRHKRPPKPFLAKKSNINWMKVKAKENIVN